MLTVKATHFKSLNVAPDVLINKSMQKVKYLLLGTGINIKTQEKSNAEKCRSLFVLLLNFIGLCSNVIAVIVWCIKGFTQNKTMTELTYPIPYIFISVLSVIKIFIVYINESEVVLLTQKILQLEINQKNKPENSEIDAIIKLEDNFLKRSLKLLNIVCFVVVICFTVSPTVMLLWNYFRSGKLVLVLQIEACYPFDPLDFKFYPWVMFYQFWTGVILFLNLITADSLFYIFCTHLRTQFCLLQYYIERVVPLKQNQHRNNVQDIDPSKLAELVKWHQELFSCVGLLESVYAKSTLFNFFTSSILICFSGFNILELESFALNYLVFLLLSLLQIFLPCLFSDLLKESSLALVDAVYFSEWYFADRSAAKVLLSILKRSQTSCKLTAWGYSDVNLRAFIKICSTAWSYFALLQTLYSRRTQEL